ncbi:Hin recombinase [Streptomyces sp. TRM72054]|uniref:helix-turn-helix domain-containing protein n=1 Tax=Streptomyces sp. TRM72054 TaxID=2870562 RepID=UPI001C8CA3F4|nr:helix-turn-helix domain-containing protein [Streptomyces sp. TRM72054]MBX9392239.1 Hin recombinase [Streptomyces sp. TRM72054]
MPEPTDQQREWGDNQRRYHPRAWSKPKLTSKQREQIVRRLADGEGVADLAAEYGVSTATIRSLRRTGWTPS